ncbi:TIR domain-containing protein [Candidatus Thiothrix sp. Deng01]|uniref:TIR domain-containing protein n=1 Tax=Candidatus Thiothrix phosphatis TaxID=3112415 RepID=A0ABU6CSE4_9GAMM|nr:TIR domain-containing protein [Candidatus Thiothrix sp. Deng01]MEB4589765.1 TIR domain-containing protein [Candidatus Thiothrix sp. Deng01]
MTDERKFAVALSFAGEHRGYVRKVAERLAQTLGRDAILYDEWLKAKFARPNLDTQLQTYYQQARLVVPFLSKEYKGKSWCGLEWRAIRDRMHRDEDETMLLRFDDTPIDGVFGRVDGHIDLRTQKPEQTAEQILQRLAELSPPIPFPPKKPHVDISRIPPVHGTIFGREQELATLDKAWHNPKTNVLCLTAWGGAGKSMLVQSWLDNLREKGWPDADNVFGWSFYSRGASEEWRASADRFFEDAFRWFGSSESSTTFSPWIKGEKLANLIMKQPTLLILDGLEPLQEHSGELREQGMKSLLRYLSTSNWNGLCLITSRINFRDIRIDGSRVCSLHLERLSSEAGSALLRGKNLHGPEQEFYDAVESVQGHALSLTLLGNALAELYGGDLTKRKRIRLSKDNHATSLMAFYEHKLKATPELMILYLLGLSDRALHPDTVNLLLAPDNSPWYADLFSVRHRNKYEKLLAPIRDLDEGGRKQAFHRLENMELIFNTKPGKADTEANKKILSEDYAFDCHPLIHEYFGQRFKQSWKEAWSMAHERLYRHYRDSAKDLPDTLGEMEPLFAAVMHGCQAGKAQQAMDEVYWPRIRRKDDAYISKVLGAIPTSLAILSNFFVKTWNEPLPKLSSETKADVLSWAGYRLRALGRLEAAKEPLATSLAMYEAWADWTNAANAASNLAGLYLTLGETDKAQIYAKTSVEYADLSGIPSERAARRTTLADILHQIGKLDEAEQYFTIAEQIHQEDANEKCKYLHSLWGFRYCDFLLGQGRWKEVLIRAEKVRQANECKQQKLEIALNKLMFGRAHLAQAQAENFQDANVLQLAEQYINQATEALRTANENHHLPKGYLTRARFYRLLRQKPEVIRSDLDNVFAISKHRTGNMRLYQTDYHIESAWFALDESRLDDARQHAQEAKRLIEETHYNRRLPELTELQQALQTASQSSVRL